MANPELGNEEDTSDENATIENENSEETEEQQTVDNDQTQAGEEIKPEAIPYHKDKRWIEMYEKAKRVEELEQKSATLEEKLNRLEQMKSDEPVKVPEAFKRLFGDDEEVYKLWKSEQDEREKSLRAEIIKEINESKQKEIETQQKEEAEWQEYFDAEIDALKEDGFEFDDEKLTKFVIDNDITDSKGVYDLKKGLLKMMNTKPAANPARKQIAGMTGGSGNSSEPAKKEYATPDDFQGKGWGSL